MDFKTNRWRKQCRQAPRLSLIHIFLSLGLGNVKDRYHLVGGYLDFLFLGDGLPVLADNGLRRVRVYLLYFLFDRCV